MSETQTDPQTPDETGEPVEPDESEPTGEPDEAIEPDEDGDEPDEPDEPNEFDGDREPEFDDAPKALSEKDIEKRYQKLAAEKVRHAKRVGEIMDEDATDLIPCPVCMDGIDGWIYPPDVQPLNEESISRIRQVIGLPDYTNFRHVGWAVECPTCGGLGKVITGSKVPGREVTGCTDCNEAGWINRSGIPQTNGHHADEPMPVTGPTVLGTNEPDSRIAGLLSEGYTVIPPLNLPTS